MTTISGFTFIHNAIEGGYPIAESIEAVQPFVSEIVVVDMQSTDGTRELLESLDCRIIDGIWGDQAGLTLRDTHSKYVECSGDIIIHFEADEVYDPKLLFKIVQYIEIGMITDLAVWRLQVEQNFQRIRWYPEPVHRVFSRFSHTKKQGHTTNRHTQTHIISPEYGFLWDVTNCFRDNWLKRVDNQAQLWHGDHSYLMVPLHCMHDPSVSREAVIYRLNERHWTWKTTPLNIPDILKPLVGMTKYEPKP